MGIKHVLATTLGVVTIVPFVHSIIANRNPAYVAGTEVASDNAQVLALEKADVKDNQQAMKDLAKAQKDQANANKDASKLEGKIDKSATAAETEEASANELEAQAIAAAQAGNTKLADKLMKQARKQRDKERKDENSAIKNQEKLEKQFPLLGQDAQGNAIRTTKKAMDDQLKAIGSMRVAAVANAALSQSEAVRSQDRATQEALILAPKTSGLISVLGPKAPAPTPKAPPVVEHPVAVKPVVAPPATPPAVTPPAVTPPAATCPVAAPPLAVEPVKTVVVKPDPATMAAADNHIATLGTRTLQEGMSGPDVAALQRFLGLHPSGTFDADTTTALTQYQIDKGLVLQDGVVGRETRPVIQQEIRSRALAAPSTDK
jgi:hypothetical protein